MKIYKQPNGRWKVRLNLGFDETANGYSARSRLNERKK